MPHLFLLFYYILAVDDIDTTNRGRRHESSLQVIAFIVWLAQCIHITDACGLHIVVLAVIIMAYMTGAIGICLHTLKQIIVGA